MNLSRDAEAFLEEMHKKNEQDYREFQYYQEQTVKTLQVFHELCVKNQIPYYLGYGSLLGAVRNGGQIPWDYDVDLWIPASQIENILRALDRDLPNTYHYATRYTDNSFRTYTLKIAPKEFDCDVIHVDIFWLFGAPEQGHEKLVKRGKYYAEAMLHKYADRAHLGVQGKAAEIKYIYKKMKYGLWPTQLLEREYKYLTHWDYENSDWCIDGSFWYVFPKKMFGTPKLLHLDNGLEFFAPSDTEGILKQAYGENYHEVPDINTRMKEMTKSLNRIRKLARISK